MKYLKFLGYLILFLFIGELIFRADIAFHPFSIDDTVNSSATIEHSAEFAMLNSHTLPISDSDLRVMVLGDSYIHGAGVNPKNNFSHRLREMLNNSGRKYRHIYVFDASRPSNNNLDNYDTYFQYVATFKPQVVVLGYNLNDVDDNLDSSSNSFATNQDASIPVKTVANPTAVQRAYDFLYHSELVHATMKNFNNELKSFGYVIPGSRLGQQLRSYSENRTNWIQSKQLLNRMLVNADEKNIRFVCFFMPEMDLLETPKIFTSADIAIHRFFDNYSEVTFINGRDVFKGLKSADFRISKYDGHPNEKAHNVIASYVSKLIDGRAFGSSFESSRSYTHN